MSQSAFGILAALAGFAFASGCGGKPVDQLADEPDRLVLYSLDGPSVFKNEGAVTLGQTNGEILHGYPVLGKVEVIDIQRKQEILQAVKEAVRTNSEPEAACFIPRHALRVEKAGVTVDMLICFQCRNYTVVQENDQGKPRTGRISSAAKPLLNQVLSDADVPLASGN